MTYQPTAECAVEARGQPVYCRGWCTKHYQRWRRHGNPQATVNPRHDLTAGDRFDANVDRSAGPAGCWPWLGTIHPDGYGIFNADGEQIRAHRFAYTRAVGTIRDGYQIDHTCHTTAAESGACTGGKACLHRRCANPAHLEAVTARTNNLRGLGHAAANARKTECKNGHPFAGRRDCRPCRRARERSYTRARRAS